MESTGDPHHMKKNLIILAPVLLALALVVLAQGDGAQLPSAEEVIGNYVKAAGGKAAFENLESMEATGTFETQGNKMPLEIAFKVPAKWFFSMKIPGLVPFVQVSNGTEGWIVQPASGDVTPMPLDQMQVTAALIDIRGPIRFADYFSHLEVTEKSNSEGRPAWLVTGAYKSGIPVKLYFDVESGLLVETDMTVTSPQGTFNLQNYFEDYRAVNGVKTPFTLRQTGASDWVITFTEFKFNAPVEDAKFEKPAGPGA
jgi:zinc protease